MLPCAQAVEAEKTKDKKEIRRREGFSASHCLSCNDCSPDLENTCVIRKCKTQLLRAVVESERIFTLVEACVSVASVTLSEKELKLVHMRRDDPR